MEQKIEVNYYFLKELLKEKIVFINVKSTNTIITFFTDKKVLISDYSKQSYGTCENIVDAASKLLKLVEDNENFESGDYYYMKRDNEWYKNKRASINYGEL